jgi:4-amino-4-deoxy-L-arabinose transferase-like glycosyltransferase
MSNLFNCSLWGDEAFSAVLAQRRFWPMIEIVANDTSPPLMYIIMWTWFRLFGSSEISIRSLTLLFYFGTTLSVYLIGKELFNKKTGIIAALLSFFNPFLFPYAFEGRMYFTLLFFITWSFYFLIKENKWGYILTASAALYSHHFAILVLVPQFLWQLIKLKKYDLASLWTVIKNYVLIGLTYIPWLYPLYLQTQKVAGGFWLGTPKIKDLANLYLNLIKHRVVYGFQKYLPFLAGIILALRKWSKEKLTEDSLLLLWAVMPPVLTFLISQTSLSIFYERYLLYCVPPLMLLLASRMRKISWLPVIGLLGIYITVSSYYFTHPHKADFRKFAQQVKENKNTTFLINYNGAAHHLWESKYYGFDAPIYTPGGDLPFFVGTAQMTDQDTISNLPENEIIGVIGSTHPNDIEINGYQKQNHLQVDKFHYLELWPK